MSHIKEELKREFIMALKTNRKVALSLEDKRKGAYERVGSLKLEPGAVLEVHLEQGRFSLGYAQGSLHKRRRKHGRPVSG
jgi:hypothetical protein